MGSLHRAVFLGSGAALSAIVASLLFDGSVQLFMSLALVFGLMTTAAYGKLERERAAKLQTLERAAEAREALIRAEGARQELDAEIQRGLAMADTEADVLEIAGGAIERIIPETPAEILLADAAQKELHLAALSRHGPACCPAATPEQCPAMRGGKTLRFTKPGALDVCPRLRERPDPPSYAACVPLSVMGRSIGVLHATPRRLEILDDAHVSQLELVAGHVGNRLGMLQVLEVFQAQASTDALTGLPNRRSFEERAMPALRAGLSAAVAILDIDHFKRVNDTFGHAAGDTALRQLAAVMTESLGASGALGARRGGEEFAANVPNGDVAGAVAVFDRLRADLSATLERGTGPRFTVSAGVAIHSRDGKSLTELLAAADAALYRAKAEGRDRVVLASTPRPANVSSIRPRAA
jgi:diguanylate cyclase (GGDEF)-like protein